MLLFTQYWKITDCSSEVVSTSFYLFCFWSRERLVRKKALSARERGPECLAVNPSHSQPSANVTRFVVCAINAVADGTKTAAADTCAWGVFDCSGCSADSENILQRAGKEKKPLSCLYYPSSVAKMFSRIVNFNCMYSLLIRARSLTASVHLLVKRANYFNWILKYHVAAYFS